MKKGIAKVIVKSNIPMAGFSIIGSLLGAHYRVLRYVLHLSSFFKLWLQWTIIFLLSHLFAKLTVEYLRKVKGHVQTNRSKAGLSSAELARCFMLVLFLLSVWTALICLAPRFLSGHTNTNNTNIKHRASSALLSPALLLFVWRRPKSSTIINISPTPA